MNHGLQCFQRHRTFHIMLLHELCKPYTVHIATNIYSIQYIVHSFIFKKHSVLDIMDLVPTSSVSVRGKYTPDWIAVHHRTPYKHYHNQFPYLHVQRAQRNPMRTEGQRAQLHTDNLDTLKLRYYSSNLENFNRSLDIIFNTSKPKEQEYFMKSTRHGVYRYECVTVLKSRPNHAVTFSSLPLVSFCFSLMLSLKAIKL